MSNSCDIPLSDSERDLKGPSYDELEVSEFLTRPVIIIATGNAHKVTEIAAALGGAEGSPLAGARFEAVHTWCSGYVDPIEDGATFEDNAAIKAHAAHYLTRCPALADDSGLVVDALDGAPGIYSARYSGVEHDDAGNNEKLLRELSGAPAQRRRARFVSCLVVVGLNTVIDRPGYGYLTVTGTCEGMIGFEPQGNNGFGYDPLFLPDATPGRSMAQLTLEEKTAISHRGDALRKLLERLRADQ